MKKLSADELQRILDDHKTWLNDQTTGSRADFSGANLREVDLSRSDLRAALFIEADLYGIDLSECDLREANFSGANLSWSNLCQSDFREANLLKADLAGANISDVDLRGANLPATIVVPHIDAAILNAVKTKGLLDMLTWHTCKTTHCRAGWAIVLAGEAGATLETEVGPAAAGALIYAASRPNRRVPEFFTSNEDALSDMEKCAAFDPII